MRMQRITYTLLSLWIKCYLCKFYTSIGPWNGLFFKEKQIPFIEIKKCMSTQGHTKTSPPTKKHPPLIRKRPQSKRIMSSWQLQKSWGIDVQRDELNLITFQSSLVDLSTPPKILLFLSSEMPHKMTQKQVSTQFFLSHEKENSWELPQTKSNKNPCFVPHYSHTKGYEKTAGNGTHKRTRP